MADGDMTPDEAIRYLRGRYRDLCDRHPAGSRINWNTLDLEAVNVVLREREMRLTLVEETGS